VQKNDVVAFFKLLNWKLLHQVEQAFFLEFKEFSFFPPFLVHVLNCRKSFPQESALRIQNKAFEKISRLVWDNWAEDSRVP